MGEREAAARPGRTGSPVVPGARLWWGLPALALLLWALGLLTVWGPSAVAFARSVISAIVLGCAVVAVLVLPRPPMLLLRWAAGWLALWLVVVGTEAARTGEPVQDVVLGLLARAEEPFAVSAVVVVHALAALAWIGAVAVAVALGRARPDLAPSLLPRLGAVALWCVVLVTATGLVTSLVMLGSPSALVGTAFGSLVLAKAVLLAWIVRLGWVLRRHGTERLAGWEAIGMGLALAVSVAVTRLGPPAPETTGGPISPLPVVLLALAVPILIAWSFPPRRPPSWIRWLRSYPEVPALVLLVVVVEVSGSGILDVLVGREAGALVGSALLVASGWAWATGALGGRGIAAVVIVMVAWPWVTWFSSLLAGSSQGWRPSVVALLLAEALLAAALVRVRTASIRG